MNARGNYSRPKSREGTASLDLSFEGPRHSRFSLCDRS